MRSTTRQAVIVFLILFSGMVVLRLWYGRAAPVPDAFQQALPLAQAIERAAELDKPVLVLATADWCMPCQHLKRGALRDERVVEAIRAKTVPVYLDVTNSNNTEIIEAAKSVNVEGIPALIAIKGGRELARIEGDVPPIRLLSWLDQF